MQCSSFQNNETRNLEPHYHGYCYVKGVGVADVFKALVVCIDPAGVRVPAVAAMKMDVGRPPYRR